MIDLRQLRQFVAVAEELSFRKAAERLHMAQPPLTAAIRHMEEELGTVLLERSNRVERLTPSGQVLLEEARRTLRQADRALQLTRRAAGGLVGSLRISFVASAAHGVLPAILRAFSDAHGEVDLVLREATTTEQLAALQDGQADIGLVVLPCAGAGDLELVALREEALVAALPEGHPLAAQANVELPDLAQEPWILFPRSAGPGLHDRIVSACRSAGFVPRVAQEAIQMETIAALVAGGVGVALVAPPLAAAGRAGVAFRPLVGKGTPVGYQLALAFARRTPLVDAFVAVARQCEIPGGANAADA
ncbi:LysR family transcriptional regulator [Variovorax paradoxus]|uniref:HTH-type transcriptional regulator BenM n=1 Tax=Variovorax paradoxus TaxID=34073 RepID=A0A0H2M9D5_VARPD|nr:LysR family transcriptional regulator [Variovorax paradoxus]KLN57312.1 HTH-type transcriptional regulator BenM [Variovorax paradoxus]